MSGPVTVKFEGGPELEAAFKSLMDDFDASKATVKNVMRRGLKDAIQPMADLANELAPDDPATPGGLNQSYHVGTQLTARQRGLAKLEPKDFVTVYMGTTDPAGVQTEFGNSHQSPQAHVRPAFAQEALNTINRVAGSLKDQLAKAVTRAQRKALRSTP